MAERVHNRGVRAPKRRLAGQPGYFYTSEVARILRWSGVDYAQIRSLLELGRPASNQPTRQWARYDIRDLASMRTAIQLLGGTDALKPGRRLNLRPLRDTCTALRQAGYEYPLLQVPIARVGRQFVALVAGVVFEPSSGQLVFERVLKELDEMLKAELPASKRTELRSMVAAEKKSIKPPLHAQSAPGNWTLNVRKAV
jgi:hypothetical protein